MAGKSVIDFDQFERSLQTLTEPENKLNECEKALDRILLQLGWNGNCDKKVDPNSPLAALSKSPKVKKKYESAKLTDLAEEEKEDEEEDE